MEVGGIVEMYEKSAHRYNICYNRFIGDGDSSAYSTIDHERPYGPTVFMGANLRRLIKEYGGRKLEDGKGHFGKGRLTISHINFMEGFYSHAIRNNKRNVKKMSKEIWAILHHY